MQPTSLFQTRTQTQTQQQTQTQPQTQQKKYFGRFKTSPEFPECLECGGTDTKEHYFTQTWCRGRRRWEAESCCLGCLRFSHRSYEDPDFETPEEHEKRYWTEAVRQEAAAADGGARAGAGAGAAAVE